YSTVAPLSLYFPYTTLFRARGRGLHVTEQVVVDIPDRVSLRGGLLRLALRLSYADHRRGLGAERRNGVPPPAAERLRRDIRVDAATDGRLLHRRFRRLLPLSVVRRSRDDRQHNLSGEVGHQPYSSTLSMSGANTSSTSSSRSSSVLPTSTLALISSLRTTV